SRSDFSIRVNVAPELGHRLKLRLQFLPVGGPARAYDLPGSSRRVPLDPRWYEAAWTFVRDGAEAPFTIERLVFLLCLAAPLRRRRGLVAIVLVLAALQAVSTTTSAFAAPADWRLIAPMFDTCLAVAVVYLAVENVVAPSLRRRWLIVSVVGVLG